MDVPEPASSAAAPPRKRRRPALSCEQCRRRKIKCDRNYPCGQCLQSATVPCSYNSDTIRVAHPRTYKDSITAQSSAVIPNRARSIPGGSSEYTSSAVVSPNTIRQSEGTHASSWTSPSAGHDDDVTPDPKSLLDRTQKVEVELAGSTSEYPFHLCESYKSHASSNELRGTVSKTRFFGPSHWMYSYGTFDKVALLTVSSDNNTPSLSGDLELSAIGRHIKQVTEKCKSLARTVKAIPYSQWLDNPNFREAVPEREMADVFVDLYFRTSESVYRILHIPSFRKEYEQYWQQPDAVCPVLILKLLLVMSIGACFYQGSDAQHYRLEATKWIFAAQAWLASPFEKSRLHTSTIQLQCLLLLARQGHSIAGDLVWISAGALLRTAMQMGFHRDPKVLPKMSAMQAEIRRRLWATILELNIQSAIDSGMPLLLSSDAFDTDPPANIDDVDITETMLGSVTPKPNTTFTQCSIQIALLKSFPIRLEVVRFSNNLRHEPSYDEVLRVGAALSKACKDNNAFISRANQSLRPQDRVTQLQRNLLDLSIRRFLLLVHRPYAAKAQKDPHYYFSRKVSLDTAVTLLKYPCSDYPTNEETSNNDIRDDYAQLKRVNGGFFKSVMVHVAMVIFAELYTQLEEETTFTEHSQSGRESLKQCLRDIIILSRERIAAGENNVKGNLFISVVLAQLEAMEDGLDSERIVLDAATKSADRCYDLLVSRTSAGINVPLRSDNISMNGIPGFGGVQDLGMDFAMQDWSMDQDNLDGWFKSGFEDGVWWHC